MLKATILAFAICAEFAGADKVMAGPLGICSLANLQGNWQIYLDSRGDLAFGACNATIDAAGVLSANCDQIGDAGGLDPLTATLRVTKACRVTNVGGPFQYFDHHVGSAALLNLNAWLSIDRDAINGKLVGVEAQTGELRGTFAAVRTGIAP